MCLIKGVVRIPEQCFNMGKKQLRFGIFQVWFPGKELLGSLLGPAENTQIRCQGSHPEGGKTTLPVAEEVAGTSQLQILLGDLKAIVGGAQSFESLSGLLILVVRD